MTPIQQAYKLYRADKTAEALAFLEYQRPRKPQVRNVERPVAEAIAPVAKPAFGNVEKVLFTAIIVLGMFFTLAVMIVAGA